MFTSSVSHTSLVVYYCIWRRFAGIFKLTGPLAREQWMTMETSVHDQAVSACYPKHWNDLICQPSELARPDKSPHPEIPLSRAASRPTSPEYTIVRPTTVRRRIRCRCDKAAGGDGGGAGPVFICPPKPAAWLSAWATTPVAGEASRASISTAWAWCLLSASAPSTAGPKQPDPIRMWPVYRQLVGRLRKQNELQRQRQVPGANKWSVVDIRWYTGSCAYFKPYTSCLQSHTQLALIRNSRYYFCRLLHIVTYFYYYHRHTPK